MNSKLAFFAVLTVAFTAIAGGKVPTAESTAKKVDFLFLEAQRQKALEHNTLYAELLESAYRLDTTQTYIGNELGYTYLMSGRIQEGYRLMQRHFATHPEDLYSSNFFGGVAMKSGDFESGLRVYSYLDSVYPHRPEIAFKHAEARAMKGDLDSLSLRNALAILQRLEDKVGKSIDISAEKARYLSQLQDSAELLNEAGGLLQYSPMSVDSYLFAAQVNQLLGRGDTVMHYYGRAIDINPEDGRPYFMRAEYLRQTGDSIGFDREVFNVLANTDFPVDQKTELLKTYVADLYTDSLQRPRITEMFDLMIDRNPHEIDLRNLYASYLNLLGEYAPAAEQMEVIVDLDPSEPLRAAAVCQLYLSADSLDTALRKGLEYEKRFPDEPVIKFVTGTIYSLLGQPQKAIEATESALQQAEKQNADPALRSDMLQSLADHYVLAGDTIAGFERYEKAIELNPENYLAMNNFAYFITLSGGDLDRAEDLSRKTIVARPTSPTELDTYAWVLFNKKDYKKAKEYIDRALGFMEREDAALLEHAGDVYYFNGLPSEALGFWERAASLDPDNRLLQKKIKHKTYFYE